MFDENDGFFDHVAPPAAPSLNKDGTLRGKTTADATLEWHTKGDIRYRNQPYGLGPRVPMYVISPWSKGGWVNSQVFDHTSVIRFLEQRFGVMEPNISPWRRAVCGDLTSAFNFANPNNEPFPELPDTSQADAIVASQIKLPKPKPPAVAAMPKQEMGIRPARALPYELGVHARYRSGGDALSLTFANTGKAGAVFQVFDLLDSENPPKRYTVGARKRCTTASRATPAATTTWKCTVRTVSSGSSVATCGAIWRSARRRCRKCGSTTSRCSATCACN